jgi:sigma-B regulation protein RsbU (phosphoserine phosphatase)
MNPDGQVVALLRGQIADIILGTVFLFFGLIACAIAAIRRRSGVRLILWLGVWSAMDGLRQLAQLPAVDAVLPHWMQVSVPYLNTTISYLVLVVATLAFLELNVGRIRFFFWAVVLAALAIALAGIGVFIVTGSDDKLMPENNLVAACSLAVLATIVSVPRLSRKFLALPNRAVLVPGTLIFALQAVYTNLAGSLHYQALSISSTLGLAVLLFSFSYVALQMVFASERRLLAIDKELEIARRLQFSILPENIPKIENIRIAAAYQPMTAVAGDFYAFLPADQHRAGFLVADVSGHGVPAALIASMIKVAMQSVTAWTHEPAEVLRRLGAVLSGQLRDQYVSAAYLWIDTETRQARYSAAGHPPLLCWRAADDALIRIESNGVLFGVDPKIVCDGDYPVLDLPLAPGDRFLLYTDGIVEPENAAGESFGDRKLEEIVRDNQASPAPELSGRLLAEVRAWQPASLSQQDDITLVIIDVL